MSKQNIKNISSMENKQNKFMNLKEEKVIELIKPYQEKIKKLQEEISQKDLEIAQLKYKLYQYNNTNKNINQISNSKNQIINTCPNDDNYISINIKFENGKKVSVQCKPQDKLEIPIQHFINTTVIKKEDFDFLIMKKGKKIKINSTVKENGLIKKNYYILVKKKSNNNNQEDESSDDDDDDDLNYNNEILGTPMNIIFESNSGIKISIGSGKNNTFKDLVIKYCQIINQSLSVIRKSCIFLYNSQKLKINNHKTLEQIGLKENSNVLIYYKP